ncbi:hypothetical protein L6V77_35740, partial [Myxococcota bacterium]|nr:hypothetical protein [Myxococcota bacterium]
KLSIMSLGISDSEEARDALVRLAGHFGRSRQFGYVVRDALKYNDRVRAEGFEAMVGAPKD